MKSQRTIYGRRPPHLTVPPEALQPAFLVQVFTWVLRYLEPALSDDLGPEAAQARREVGGHLELLSTAIIERSAYSLLWDGFQYFLDNWDQFWDTYAPTCVEAVDDVGGKKEIAQLYF